MNRKIIFLSLLSLLQFVVAHFLLLQHFANSGDEQSYLFQARLFASGKLFVEDPIYNPAHPLNRYVAADAMNDIGGRRFSKYSPGWPALLSLGIRAGAPWIVNPILAAFTMYLLLCYVRKRMGGEFVGTAWWLLTLCPFFFLSVASFGSHTSAMTFLFAAFYVYDGALTQRQEHSGWRFFFVGVLLGFSALIRYLDWIPLMVLITVGLLRARKINGLMAIGLGFGLLCSCHLLYNDLLSGSPMVLPTSLYAKGGLHDHLFVSWHGFEVTAIRILRLVYALPTILLLFFFSRRSWLGAGRAYLALFALNAVTYFFYIAAVGGPGPRYFMPYFPFLVLAIVAAIRSRPRHSAVVRRAYPAVIVAQIVLGFVYTATQWHEIYERKDLERSVNRVAGTKKIILLQTGTYKMELRDLIRNPPEMWAAGTLYFAYDQDPALMNLLNRFPEHKIYLYRYPGMLTPWR